MAVEQNDSTIVDRWLNMGDLSEATALALSAALCFCTVLPCTVDGRVGAGESLVPDWTVFPFRRSVSLTTHLAFVPDTAERRAYAPSLRPGWFAQKRLSWTSQPGYPLITANGFTWLCRWQCGGAGARGGCGAASTWDTFEDGECVSIAAHTESFAGGRSHGSYQFLRDFIERIAPMLSAAGKRFVVVTNHGDTSYPSGDLWHTDVEDVGLYNESFASFLEDPHLIHWFSRNCDWRDYTGPTRSEREAARIRAALAINYATPADPQDIPIPPPKLTCIPIGWSNVRTWRFSRIPRADELFDVTIALENQTTRVPGGGAGDESLANLLLIEAGVGSSIKPLRQVALEALRDKPFVTVAPSRMRWGKWAELARSSAFVLSPPGHGFDCYRTWELLTLGVYPVVLSSDMDSVFAHLPVLIVQRWSDLSEELLRAKYAEFRSTEWLWGKLSFAYWEHVMLANGLRIQPTYTATEQQCIDTINKTTS